MKKIRTADMLEDDVVADLGWRRKELTTLKLMHDAARDHQREFLRRAGIALLYAHWEGFVKHAGTAYVEFVVRQGATYARLKPNFVAMGAKKELVQFAQTARGGILCKVSEFFINGLGTKVQINWDKAVETKSNLSAERTRDIIALLGLDYRPFEVHEKTIIQDLMEKRNDIAHGQHLGVAAKQYENFHTKVLEMMDELKLQIVNAASSKEYLRA